MKLNYSIAVACGMLAGTAQASAAVGSTPVRFATFNASLNRFNAGDFLTDMNAAGTVNISVAYPNSASNSTLTPAQKRVLQAHYMAETVQRINPDVLMCVPSRIFCGKTCQEIC